jgi:hypothetical protein
MTKFQRSGTLFAITALTVVVLGGCSPVAPPSPTGSGSPTRTATPTPRASSSVTPSPTPTADVTVATVVINGTSLIVENARATVLLTIPFTTDAVTAVTQLGQALGTAPLATSHPDAHCASAYTDYNFGGITLYSGAQAPGAQFHAVMFSPTTGTGVALDMPGGFSVGDSISAAQAANPGSYTSADGQGTTFLYFDVQSTGPDGPDSWGAMVVATVGDTILNLRSPTYYHGDC